MYDKIADIYKYYLEDKIPDNYIDPDVRKIVARASKYTLLNSDGSFYPKEKYKDIYEKLKKIIILQIQILILITFKIIVIKVMIKSLYLIKILKWKRKQL